MVGPEFADWELEWPLVKVWGSITGIYGYILQQKHRDHYLHTEDCMGAGGGTRAPGLNMGEQATFAPTLRACCPSATIIIIIIDDYGRRRIPLSPHLLQL